MQFIIHKGTKEIWGSCVEIKTSSTRILIDFGMPLHSVDQIETQPYPYNNQSITDLIKNKHLPDIEGLFESGNNPINAILISHAHLDHYGLISFVNESIPVYSGVGTQILIQLTHQYVKGKTLQHSFFNFRQETTFSIGDISITPYLMDHSAFDAYAFLIEADGKRLFYSGDFRAHGRKSSVFQNFINNPPKDVDYLLMEGTTIGRPNHPMLTEFELELSLKELFQSREGLHLIMTSSQNIDRIISLCKACITTGKTLIIDPYTTLVLKWLNQFKATIPYPSKEFSFLRIYFSKTISNRVKERYGDDEFYSLRYARISKDELLLNHKRCVFAIKSSMMRDVESLHGVQPGFFIYSLWNGYLETSKIKKIDGFLGGQGYITQKLHSSGHASIKDLNKLAQAINPKVLVPIHTNDPKSYKKEFKGLTIKLLQDKEIETIH